MSHGYSRTVTVKECKHSCPAESRTVTMAAASLSAKFAGAYQTSNIPVSSDQEVGEALRLK